MSHGDHASHLAVIRRIRTLNKDTDHTIAILLDTKGPEVRSGDVKRGIELKAGDTLTFTTRQEAQYDERCVEVSYDGFVRSVQPGDIILVDGGMMTFKVEKK
eukprot:CAMPEP_0196664034 /NCGR_PEP_ID=MMETSP1086-20130531/55274_1 /TAXON_ID=77921 /ORGANISM="Cyanoptyche  gloeocystis , Strain SAG4.97" /LENGTH=101 /DNA_ID=CAMNT_0042000115 /DNA_START=44 /DNA_END=346 /DNA_ORIENTATION=-